VLSFPSSAWERCGELLCLVAVAPQPVTDKRRVSRTLQMVLTSMDFYTAVSVSALLLLAAAGLMVAHVRAWRAFREQELDAEEFDYRRRQFRRRMQTSAMLGLLAAALLAGYVLGPWMGAGWFSLAFWGAVLGGVGWVLLLAAVDVWATKHHFGRLRHRCLVEQAKLEAEVRRIQALRGNGKAASTPEPRPKG
jgi:hypothetical protein